MRKGEVSSIDYKNGMVSVTFMDWEGGTTDMLPCLSIGDEYKMPQIGETVAVGEMSSGHGIVLGKLWNRGNTPGKSGKGLYFKRLTDTAEISASGNDGMRLKDSDIVFDTDYGTVTVSEIMGRLEALEGGA